MSIAEISVALERTRADIREQMGKLLSQNFVESLPAVLNMEPGRPAARFAVVQKTPDPLAKGVVSGLLEYLVKNDLDQANSSSIIEMITDALLKDFHPVGITSAVRLNQAVKYLDKLGTKASWIATKSGPKLSILQESFSPFLGNSALSKKMLKELLRSITEKAVRFSPTA